MSVTDGDTNADGYARDPLVRGARLAILGPVAYFLPIASLRKAVDGVPPATGLGTLNATLWLCTFLAVGAFGRFVVGGPGWVWFVVAVAVMTVVAKWWPWSRAKVEERLSRYS